MKVIKLILENGNELDYEKVEDLGLKFNRIVDDYQKPDLKWSDFSMTVGLPKTRNNTKQFEFPDVHLRTKIFNGKEYGCKVVVDGQIMFDGKIRLKSFDGDSYKCLFFSYITDLGTAIKGKKLVDLTTLPIIENWNYETSIANHIALDYTSSDYTDYQFPFIYYRSPMVSGGTLSNTTEEQAFGYFYNYINSGLVNVKGKNFFYKPQFAPAIYLKSIFNAIISEAGYTLSGTFFEDHNIKRIVIPFTGKPEQYIGAITTGSTITPTLNLNKTLPDVAQLDFLKGVINAFNLYFTIKDNIITFETHDTLFKGNSNAYDLTDKIDRKTVETSETDGDYKITLATDSNNNLPFGYGRLMDYNYIGDKHPVANVTLNKDVRLACNYYVNLTGQYNKNVYENHWNKIEGDNEVKLSFTPVNYVTYSIYNDRTFWSDAEHYANARYPSPVFPVSIPLISEQTATDNKGFLISEEETTSYCEGNNDTNWQYQGGLKMLYHYGTVRYDMQITGGTTRPFQDYAYVCIATGGTCEIPTFKKVRIPIASPYQLLNFNQYRSLTAITATYTGGSNYHLYDTIGAEAQSLMMTYMSAGSLTGLTYNETEFSLTFSDNADYKFDNIYSKFHRYKCEMLKNSEILSGSMRCNSNDWNNLTIDRTILYNGEYYKLVSIKNYDIQNESATITMIKKI